MDKSAATVDVIALETITMGGESHKPGTRIPFPKDEAQRLVDASAAAWPTEDDETVKPNRPSGRDLLAAIGQAMRAIDPMEGVTPEGKASLYALAHHLGYEVTAEERDEAHAEFSSRRDLFAGAKGAGQVAAEMIEKVKSHDFGDPLLNAIRDLKGDVPANWTQDGRPDARALSEILRRNVSAGERDEAWDKYRKALAELTEKK